MVQLYLLTGLSILAAAFLIMIAVQLFRIEKTISEITDFAENRVKRIYQKG